VITACAQDFHSRGKRIAAWSPLPYTVTPLCRHKHVQRVLLQELHILDVTAEHRLEKIDVKHIKNT